MIGRNWLAQIWWLTVSRFVRWMVCESIVDALKSHVDVMVQVKRKTLHCKN